ncbi:hypothetical protein BN1723_007661 [Verticillium longisporum]|uniref:Secreted protein n=1 Tax=Verticillium longisporum TaxID=100787 RepID=A0A0G4NMF5_VERLO|nr:hypothetical protein BN1708_007814 [Verticillium longisporum]CRK47642.1 hypothetical protein BN1723_007661 [Verticillium longisporum]
MAASWCAFWHCVTLAPLAELPWSDGPSAQADRQTQDQDPTTNGDSTALGTHARKTGCPNGSDSAKDPCCGCFLLSLHVVFNESSDARSHGHTAHTFQYVEPSPAIFVSGISPMLSNTRAFHVQLHTLPVCMPFNQMESTEWKAQRGIRLLGNIAPTSTRLLLGIARLSGYT